MTWRNDNALAKRKPSEMNYSTSTACFHASRRDKSGTPQHRKSVIADGDFIKKMGDSGYFGVVTRRGRVVVRSLVNLPITHPDSRETTARPWRDLNEEPRGLFYH